MDEKVSKKPKKDALEESIPKKMKGDDDIVLALIKQAESFLQTMNEARLKSQFSSVVKAQENISKISNGRLWRRQGHSAFLYANIRKIP